MTKRRCGWACPHFVDFGRQGGLQPAESRLDWDVSKGGRALITRRLLLGAGVTIAASLSGPALARKVNAAAITTRARELAGANAGRVAKTDLVGIADYAAPSWLPRFHLVDLAAGKTTSFLVSHGRGSDPAHTGWLERFSNELGSNASSFGAYRTGEEYTGKHGRSMRLIGLDAENSNAESRAIVVHGAWYVSDAMVATHGKIGRSEGCFAFSEGDLGAVLDRLGPGRLLFAGQF
jgi:hypothetical protein